jgi:hypothetical protein
MERSTHHPERSGEVDRVQELFAGHRVPFIPEVDDGRERRQVRERRSDEPCDLYRPALMPCFASAQVKKECV